MSDYAENAIDATIAHQPSPGERFYPAFEVTPELDAAASEYVTHYPEGKQKSAVLPILHEIQKKFGMTLSAIYTFVSKNAIPKKKEGIMVYYSKKHVDIAKGVAAPEEPQYYTVAEAMEKFNLTRDQLYHYAKYHNIPKVKKGKYTLISKPELDKLLAAPKIE